LISFELIRYLRKNNLPFPTHLFAAGYEAPHIARNREKIYLLSDEMFCKKVHDLNGTPEDVLENKESRLLFLPILRADYTLTEEYSYTHESALPCPITAFGGDRDPNVAMENLAAWEHQTVSRFKRYIFAGDHFFVRSARADVLRIISRELAAYIYPAFH